MTLFHALDFVGCMHLSLGFSNFCTYHFSFLKLKIKLKIEARFITKFLI